MLVDLFTEEHGRITVIAKGARSKRSAQKSILQPFTPLLLRWVGKGSLKTLTKSEAAAIALPLQSTALYSGLYLNEILSRVIEPETSYPQLFQEYLIAITSLAQSHRNIEPILRTFEFKLLNTLGYGVSFERCAGSGDPISEDMTYQYHPEKGFTASLVVNHNSYYGRELLAFAQYDFSQPRTRSAAKRFTRNALKPYLGSQPLKSRELFQQLLPGKLKA